MGGAILWRYVKPAKNRFFTQGMRAMASVMSRDFDEFADALAGVDGRYLLLGSATRDWCLEVIALDGVTVMHGQDGAANLFQAACVSGVCSLFVPLDADCVTVNGTLLEQDHASWLATGSEFHIRARTAQRWVAVMIQLEAFDALHIDGDVVRACVERTRSGPVPAPTLAHLFALLQRARRADREQAVSAARLRDGIVRMCLCVLRSIDAASARQLCTASNHARGRPPVPRQTIIRRALDVIQADSTRQVHMIDLCQATGVSARTLQSVFRENFGMSPYRYIVVRRLHDVHAAIRTASPRETVSEICARHGIGDFGRFARAYRRHFGLAPSRMLAMRTQR